MGLDGKVMLPRGIGGEFEAGTARPQTGDRARFIRIIPFRGMSLTLFPAPDEPAAITGDAQPLDDRRTA